MVLKAKQIPFGQKVSDLVNNTVKSWNFILVQFSMVTLWIFLNSSIIKADPYPFHLLQLLLVIETSFIANMVFMSQCRSLEKDRRVALGDYYLEVQIKNEIKNIRPTLDRIDAKLELMDKKNKQ